jgi:ABC-type uncharacterized transport system substrate-binding protein
VISSIEQKSEGNEKKQQLAKEYREKVWYASYFNFVDYKQSRIVYWDLRQYGTTCTVTV